MIIDVKLDAVARAMLSLFQTSGRHRIMLMQFSCPIHQGIDTISKPLDFLVLVMLEFLKTLCEACIEPSLAKELERGVCRGRRNGCGDA